MKSLNKTPSNMFVSRSARCAMLAGAVSLWSSLPLSGATDVPADSNLATYINGATPTSYEFNLLGNVTLPSIAYINTANRSTIFIEGNDYTITRSGGNNVFWITDSLVNASLTIRNATITSSDTNTTWGAISVNIGANNATIDLDGTTIRGNVGATGSYAGGLATLATNTQVLGNVTFDANYGITSGDGAGAVALGAGASLTFQGKTTFINNYTGFYGGAVSVRDNASITFKDTATFTNNYATSYFGGAIDLWSGNSKLIFEKDVNFTGNYVKNTVTLAHAYAVRGGAISVGYLAGTGSPQVDMQGRSEFVGNYVWGNSTTMGVGGAISFSSAAGNPIEIAVAPGYTYGANIAQGIFTNNYAYSDAQDGYGGAIFAKAYNSTLSLGSGSSFAGNAAKTLGGAIYFDQGTLNLTGDVNFSGNRQGVTFSTTGDVLTPNVDSGSANAIYFSVSSNTATLNLSNNLSQTISFADPIESASGKTVTVNKTDTGKVSFTGYNSDILAQTTVSGGTFELGAGAGYGRLGTSATSNFNLASGATLIGGAGATLRASDINLHGRIEVASGQFNLSSSDAVELSNSSALVLTIIDKNTYSSVDFGGAALTLGGGSLILTAATDYVPSWDMSDFFTIVSSISAMPSGLFAEGTSIMINGAEFEIQYNANNITLQQITVIPEPSTYGILGGIGLLGLLGMHRRLSRRR